MKGTKHISDLITSPDVLLPGRINIIDADVSAGKTHFALTVLPTWSAPERILYLIDTTNGELRIQRNILSVARMDYAFSLYGKKDAWGESNEAVNGRMPVMTYAGFGTEVQHGAKWTQQFDYIVCDEMQNLVRYQEYGGDKGHVERAENALREILANGRTKVIALSATPQKIRERFGKLCYDVPFDRSELSRLETFQMVPFSRGALAALHQIARPDQKTGILYTTTIEQMKDLIEGARQLGIRANGFWSIHASERMNEEQLSLRRKVLEEETIPSDIDLLVINAASETCIKIQSEKRKVDYMIISTSNEEVRTQVRGRYHGDLPLLYYHDIEGANQASCQDLPERFLKTRLYLEDQEALCACLKLRDPKAKATDYYKMRKVRELLEANGYRIQYKKDSKNGGKHYYWIEKV